MDISRRYCAGTELGDPLRKAVLKGRQKRPTLSLARKRNHLDEGMEGKHSCQSPADRHKDLCTRQLAPDIQGA